MAFQFPFSLFSQRLSFVARLARPTANRYESQSGPRRIATTNSPSPHRPAAFPLRKVSTHSSSSIKARISAIVGCLNPPPILLPCGFRPASTTTGESTNGRFPVVWQNKNVQQASTEYRTARSNPEPKNPRVLGFWCLFHCYSSLPLPLSPFRSLARPSPLSFFPFFLSFSFFWWLVPRHHMTRPRGPAVRNIFFSDQEGKQLSQCFRMPMPFPQCDSGPGPHGQ